MFQVPPSRPDNPSLRRVFLAVVIIVLINGAIAWVAYQIIPDDIAVVIGPAFASLVVPFMFLLRTRTNRPYKKINMRSLFLLGVFIGCLVLLAWFNVIRPKYGIAGTCGGAFILIGFLVTEMLMPSSFSQ